MKITSDFITYAAVLIATAAAFNDSCQYTAPSVTPKYSKPMQTKQLEREKASGLENKIEQTQDVSVDDFYKVLESNGYQIHDRKSFNETWSQNQKVLNLAYDVFQNPKKHYDALPPEERNQLADLKYSKFTEEEKKNIEQALPGTSKRFDEPNSPEKIFLYEAIQGLKGFYKVN